MSETDIQRMLDAAFKRIEKLENDIRRLGANQAPTLPIYDSTNFPQDAVEGQITITSDNRLFIYINGVWRPIGGPRISYGQVDQDGRITSAGSGDWSSSGGAGTSNYVVSFDPFFAVAPTVLVAPNNSNPPATPAYFTIPGATVRVSDFHVNIYDQDGTLDNDGGFNFIAIGT